MKEVLKETFAGLLANYANGKMLTDELWDEVEKNYSGEKRYYHTLEHLANLLVQLTKVKDEIRNWETVLFTLYYHDIIYDAERSDNEEKSAEFAEKRMKQLSVPDEIIEACRNQILATKSHDKSNNSDTNYFTDADLSVLGQNWKTYSSYFNNVRKEYAIYADSVYNPGRKKVLQHFLEMGRVFKTDFFFYKYEIQAKKNLQRELKTLDLDEE